MLCPENHWNKKRSVSLKAPPPMSWISTETNKIHLVLFNMQNSRIWSLFGQNTEDPHSDNGWMKGR
jgi:hypothetical protein